MDSKEEPQEETMQAPTVDDWRSRILADVMPRAQAEDEFERWAALNELDVSAYEGMNREEKSELLKDIRRIKLGIQKGRITVDYEGDATFYAKHEKSKYKNPISFKERSGSTLARIDESEKGREVQALHMMMADVAGVPPTTFNSLYGEDAKVCETLFNFLMA